MFKFKLNFRSSLSEVHGRIFDEASFTKVLGLERKRTDRSGRPFLLLLLDFTISSREDPRLYSGLISKVLSSLKLCTRATNVAGWYRGNSVIGVIFTEVREEDAVVQVILEKVREALRVNLNRKELAQVTLSVHSYPNHHNHSGDSSDSEVESELYPDSGRVDSSLLLKRSLDVFGSAALLITLSPVLLVVALAVRLTSKGPVFFRQKRIGHLGKPFTFFKFRSMYTNASCKVHEAYVERFIGSGKEDKSDGELLEDGIYKMKRDPRITPLGRFLRKASLDELPQLFNVLLGDMSLVGPRPPVPYEVERYDVWHRRRLTDAKPGITGLWQVKGRSRTTFNDMVRLDLKYLNEWSVLGDVKILLQTPWAVISCRGAC